MLSSAIRRAFIDYFVAAGHTRVESGSLIPADDPTLLFVNSGMAPFKDVFLGREQRPYQRAVTAQKCVRAGGKHNDLENVGYTARHHTFFEMLGNFSFGDYFKDDAIAHAWKLLTREIGLPAEKLWITVHLSDDETADIWRTKIGIPPERIIRLEENFWNMGDTGPCGPCSEIFYDHGPELAGGPPGSPTEDEGERFIEIWNLVFMQYERFADGKMQKLPKPSVDTGMGLERMAAVLQGVHNNYETDLFIPLIESARALCPGSSDAGAGKPEQNIASLRVIADHLRASAFLIGDGTSPSNEGRGYVLRRIIRRGLRHADKLGIQNPCFPRLLPTLIGIMGDAYPELHRQQKQISAVLTEEETQFARTLKAGMEILTAAIAKIGGARDTLNGETVFKLYDTYGFPPDLTADVAREHSLKTDWAGFEKAMQEQRKRSRAYGLFSDRRQKIPADIKKPTSFVGYDKTEAPARLLGMLNADGKPVQTLAAGETGTLIPDTTPFYAESGGQVGDMGRIVTRASLFRVTDTQKQNGIFLHFGKIEEGQMQVGDTLTATADPNKRAEIRRHHTATHLLHAALRQILGDHALQRGSLVTENRLRLDFAHTTALDATTLAELEDWVNERIARTMPITAQEMPLTEAKKLGAVALFGEKYGERVRVVSIENTEETASVELCGGTHVANSGELGVLRIESESGVAAGIRRLVAQTGRAAVHSERTRRATLKKLGTLLGTKEDAHLLADVSSLRKKLIQTEKELHRLRAELALKDLRRTYANAESAGGTRLAVFNCQNLTQPAFMRLADDCREKFATGIAILLNEPPGSDNITVMILAGKQQTGDYPAEKLLKHLISQFGGGGGGSTEKARGGLKRGANFNLPEEQTAAIKQAALEWITAQKPDSE